MSTKLFPFGWLKLAFNAFFKHEVVLQRDRQGMRVLLADRDKPLPERKPSRAEKAARKEEADLVVARADLAALLDLDASIRSTVRHLAFVEQALAKKGWRGLYKVPLDVLQRALEQLEGMVTNWGSPGLACLRSKMAVAVLDREQQDENAELEDPRTAAVLDNPPVVAAQAIETARASSATEEDDTAALLATYAALGLEPPAADGGLEVQGELASPSAKAAGRSGARADAPVGELKLRDLTV